ncbi:uncharacterized protein LOC8072628 isoform X1 [Sorghum bicolor]|uniref:Uncharacterized protein n=1 Tax=Sorghum bicolor TaxID=4558 RepID=A0A194YJD4_SORBI|nr:uncharacterized protein LOC8072628 isoform X1 [Sorghum bicolor]KXG20090.1 hypothetical protein SORBI_3010G153000 [Sorghum bicolor]|eukprot:XP_021304298.1 uncharacterized protein LOC8072628 isoform X1 [Sorghum bicolor]
MEEYLESMKSLRSYMNDLEDDAAKRSVEEQQQRTAIDAHDADIALVRAQAKQASEEAEQLGIARAKVGMQMAEKQGRIAALEIECATLKQTLELLHQETASTFVKLSEKRLFYTKTTETLTVKLQEQQEWLSMKNKITGKERHVAKSQSKQNIIEGEKHVMFNSEGSLDKFFSIKQESDPPNKHGKLYTQLVSAQLKIQDIKSQRSALLLEISKIKQILEQEKNIIAGFPAALKQMGMKSLEEEYKALQGDKSGEVEYFQSLDETINVMKGVSDPVKCRCGLEYDVKLVGEAMDIS